MSHEIRTPITGVVGMAEILLLDHSIDAQLQRETIENMHRSAMALLTVINDILDFSKVESGRLDIEELEFSLEKLLRDVEKILSFAACKKGLGFELDIPRGMNIDGVVCGDSGRVRQIIINLLNNSIKFTPRGHVRFSVEKSTETSETIEMKFTIKDTGIGIAEKVLKSLFQPFSQGDPSTARKFGGTGLGLTISKNLVDLMGGRMDMKSKVGSGTTATVWIPFNKPNKLRPTSSEGNLPDRLQSEMSVSGHSSGYEFEQRDSPPSVEHLKRRRSHWEKSSPLDFSLADALEGGRGKYLVLVVEDNEINQIFALRTIGRLGFPVVAVWNGQEALDYLDAARNGTKQKPSIILMDVQMPVIDGYKCTHIMRRHSPYEAYVTDVPIVAMTASAIHGDREKCMRAGMDDYLSKPVNRRVLERMLVRWIGKGRHNPSLPEGGGGYDCCEQREKTDASGIALCGENTSEERHDEGNGRPDRATPMALVRRMTDESENHFPGFILGFPSSSSSPPSSLIKLAPSTSKASSYHDITDDEFNRFSPNLEMGKVEREAMKRQPMFLQRQSSQEPIGV